MAHTQRDKKRLLARVRRIQGQTTGLERALEEGRDCAPVLQQIAAIRGAVNGLLAEVLEGHIREHRGAGNQTAKQRGEDVEEVVALLRSYLK